MKSRLHRLRVGPALAALLILSGLATHLEARSIRLRNGIIQPPTPTASRAAAPSNTGAPASGLFLVQFTGTPLPAWRAELAGLGVDLLRYVPEDAFIARFDTVPPDQIRALDFVSFVGPYLPTHKIHSGVVEAIRRQGPGAPVSVAVLFAPRSPALEEFQARRLLRNVRQESRLRLGAVVRGQILPTQLQTLARSAAVLWIEESRPMRLFDEIASKIVAGDAGAGTTSAMYLGYDGAGVGVAVADSGLHNGDADSMHPDLYGRTPAFFAYGGLPDAADEHGHGTHVAGIVAGDGATGGTDEEGYLYGLGVAPGADIITQRLFDGIGAYYPPPSFEAMTRHATRAGAVIGSNSWGDDTQGRYDLSAAEFDELVRDADALRLGDQPYILEFSAGNAGPGARTVGSPAVGKNVIATGASQNDRLDLFIYDEGPDVMADFSSRGPCEDGRIKPDVVCPGTWIASLKSESATDENAWAAIDDYYFFMGGTSQAGPHASGAAAVLVQYYRAVFTNAVPSPALVKALLINSAVPLADPLQTLPPNMNQGWGRVDLTQILESGRQFDLVDQSVSLTNGQVYERRVVASSAEPLIVTLTYTDVPGLPAAVPALVNDLDLEVLSTDGALYRGNQFAEGESLPNPPATDAINNVEGVYLSEPLPGEYVVRVRARSVVEDARVDTSALDQDFALVISGDLPEPGTGVVVLDRGAYTAPGLIKVRVFDRDLAGLASVSVVARSTTEPAGESVLLLAAGATGGFTGAVATAAGPATPNGKLEVRHGDTLSVTYFDASAGLDRIAQARADLAPPVLTGVTSTNSFGQTVIRWTTDEPATSTVRYNTNTTLSRVVTDSRLTTDHAVALTGVVANLTYKYAVSSTDEAGNAATNNNGGAFFSFVAQPVATVLLVDGYTDDLFGAPPLSGYTAPLNALGVGHDVWVVADAGGSPPLNLLRAYPAVVWRVPELTGAWSATEQLTISNYLQGGGSLLVASMDMLTRLEEGGATGFIRDVLQVQSHAEDSGIAQIVGAAGDPVGSGVNTLLDYGVYDDLWSFLILFGLLPSGDISDTITTTTNASLVLFDGQGGGAALRWPRIGQSAPGRLVLLSFPLDAVPDTGGGGSARARLLSNILGFLVPGFGGSVGVALDRGFYTVPSLVTVEVTDAAAAGQGSASISAFTDTQTNGIRSTLYETTTPGVFTGLITLVAANRHPAPGQIRASDGDTLRLTYSNAVTRTVVSATALVDTQLPVITDVYVTPDYQEAIVSWPSDKPTDALVQFGASQFLDRTAYDGTFSTTHEVTLRGLRPNTTYFFQVTSTDEAGNSATDDNLGHLYSFQTLQPLSPPWSDDLEGGAGDWTVFSADEWQSEWTLGVPANGWENAAASPPNAWGSNLRGEALDYTETFLISPAIELTGGNAATLFFWHSYDFIPRSELDILEWGILYVVTTNASSAIPLAQFSDDAVNWEPVELDLTPFSGQVITLIWAYQIFSLDTAPRAGWLIDDISITMSTLIPGTVVISNNLPQASFVLSGPIYRRGAGLGLVITNAPPGEYLLEYADVFGYVTPPSQSNVLLSSQTISFQGSYAPTFGAIQITNNLAQAKYKLTGPVTLQGAGFGTNVTFAPPGQYVLTYGAVPYYQAPPPRTNILAIGQTLALHGDYTFSDANTNGIPDPWEWEHIGAVEPARTPATDTDGDGMSDYAEFMAGTHPLDRNSVLRVTANLSTTAGSVRLAWTPQAGRAYRVEGTTLGVPWTPLSSWMLPPVTNGSYQVSPAGQVAPYFLRVGVQP